MIRDSLHCWNCGDSLHAERDELVSDLRLFLRSAIRQLEYANPEVLGTPWWAAARLIAEKDGDDVA